MQKCVYCDCDVKNPLEHVATDEHIENVRNECKKYLNKNNDLPQNHSYEDYIRFFESMSAENQYFLRYGRNREDDPFFKTADAELSKEDFKKLKEEIDGRPKIKRQNYKKRRFRK